MSSFAAWMVPNDEANAAFCVRSDCVRSTSGGCRAMSAARSWYPTSPGNSSSMRTPRPKGALRPPSDLLRDATINTLTPTLRNATHTVVGTRHRNGANATGFSYWRINLAIALITRFFYAKGYVVTAGPRRACPDSTPIRGQVLVNVSSIRNLSCLIVRGVRAASEQPRRRARNDRNCDHQHDRRYE